MSEPEHARADLTTVTHWDDTWTGNVRLRLPSPWVTSTRDLQRLLRPRVRPRDRVLEIGCAPGKLLAWVAAALRADVSGVDFSVKGMATAVRLFAALKIAADLRCEDLRETSFAPGTFDLVYSVGVIEHFEDPRDMVARHLRLVKPGGTALMTVPNYHDLYGRLQRHFDAPSLEYHNVNIMTCEALAGLVAPGAAADVRAFRAGRVSAWVISLGKRWPAPIARGVGYLVNAAALLQPVDLPALCPMLVLEVVRARS